MTTTSRIWISRKEIAELIGMSYEMVANNEESLGLSLLRVRVNSRVVIFPRQETIQQLKEKFPCLKL